MTTKIVKIVSLVVVLVIVIISSDQSLCDRQYIHSNDEIELSKVVVIDPKHCNTRHDMVVVIHSTGQSTGKYFDIRQELRSGWVGVMKSRNIGVWFAIALNNNQTVNEELVIESNKYNDIIQFGFVDNYYNLTLKAIAIQRWLHRYCQSVKYMLKTDDDVFVNVDLLVKVLADFKTGISGMLLKNKGVYRQVGHKWYIPKQYYSPDIYPDYLTGQAMIADNVTRDQLLRAVVMYATIAGNYMLDIDDALLTGIIANYANITRHDSYHFAFDYCHCLTCLHTVPIHFECKQRSKTWHTFMNISKNTTDDYTTTDYITTDYITTDYITTSSYYSHTVSPIVAHTIL
ncbi:lactosylceramide 1,3-N-acetyl-beta-D-glucosaminyltransferase-like [Oppia nitens]|uniref:lactosylceramide 1,3-N-acetyl-beta-D-glucosaminyltransferase-like n=1 Tax=Oppia nitens TaxID=1686743 RepID=UPI0023DC2579|nr:lactosylceramide 1,3-N-acetyl-beta-D-glucosaminyltransferase-like [Oppia nitens]